MTSKIKNLIHDFEVSFVGENKELISQFVQKLSLHMSEEFQIGHCRFVDYKKGAAIITRAGNQIIIEESLNKNIDVRDFLVDCDFVFIEGAEASELTKRSFQINEEDIKKRNLEEIAYSLINHFKALSLKRPLYGLILAGGKSKRMGHDKGKIEYHGVTQTQYLSEVLNKSCEKIFVSCRGEQADEDHIRELPQITDRFKDMGPLGGILSAMTDYPEARWVVVACDLPYIDSSVIEQLIEESDPLKVASSFINPEKKWAEPLCTIYEPKAYMKFMKVLGLKKYCPRKVLLNSNVKIIWPKNEKALINANTPHDYELFQKDLGN